MLTGPYGAFVARQGYSSAVPETTKAALTPEEWDYWYAGLPAAVEIKDPFGGVMEARAAPATAAASRRRWWHQLERHDGRRRIPGETLERVRRRLTRLQGRAP